MLRYNLNSKNVFNLILKAFCEGALTFEDMDSLIKLKVFTKYELEYLVECYNLKKTFGNISYENFVKEYRCYPLQFSHNTDLYKKDPTFLYELIQNFIETRDILSIANKVATIKEEAKYHERSSVTSLIYNMQRKFQARKYPILPHLSQKVCNDRLDTMYSEIENSYFNITRGIGFDNQIDKYFCGITPSTTLCIAGNDLETNRFFAIQLLYKALKKGLNICYLSFNRSKSLMLLEFIAKYILENDKSCNYNEIINKKLSEQKLKSVLASFQELYSSNLKIVDIKDFQELNETYIRQTLGVINSTFFESCKKGIDIVIVDSIEDLRIDTMKGTINNLRTVISRYLDFFSELKQLSFYNNISILLLSTYTNSGTCNAVYNDGNVSVKDIKENILHHADMIISVYCNQNGIEDFKNECKVKVLKDNNMPIMSEPISVKLDRNYFCFFKEKRYIKLKNDLHKVYHCVKGTIKNF